MGLFYNAPEPTRSIFSHIQYTLVTDGRLRLGVATCGVTLSTLSPKNANYTDVLSFGKTSMKSKKA